MKLLIGGSPCTHWSIAQKNNRETEAEGIGWELFRNYLIAKEKFQPDFFLYENNKSAAQPIKDQISKELGVPLQYINSALVSAQNRQRFYAHNWDCPQPEDRGLLLRDILESGTDLTQNEKGYCLTASYNGACAWNTIERSQRTMVAEPVNVTADGKSQCIRACYYKDGIRNLIGNNIDKRTCVAEPVRIGSIGSESQAHRVYSSDGKSVCLQSGAGGQGAKTGLYACPVNVTLVPFVEKAMDEIVDKYGYLPDMFNPYNRAEIKDKHPTFTASGGNRQTDSSSVFVVEPSDKPIYEVRNGYITIKDKQYPIKLADGYYIIRKLTVTECCRLQTMPDNYCRAVSASQGYKGLGNGWTAEVIIHQLQYALKDIPKDEPIIVLSMYDGIGTGRYCLDKMGFTNITYYAYEIDKYAMQIAMSNYPDIIQCGDAFAVRNEDWQL